MREESLPGPQMFLEVMERTIQLVGQKMPRSTLQGVAEAFRSLRWNFPDYGLQIYFLVNEAGDVSCATEWRGPVDCVLAMDAGTFHQAAYGKINFGAALLTGKLSIQGVSALNLSKFTPLLTPFLDGYRQAYNEYHGPKT